MKIVLKKKLRMWFLKFTDNRQIVDMRKDDLVSNLLLLPNKWIYCWLDRYAKTPKCELRPYFDWKM